MTVSTDELMAPVAATTSGLGVVAAILMMIALWNPARKFWNFNIHDHGVIVLDEEDVEEQEAEGEGEQQHGELGGQEFESTQSPFFSSAHSVTTQQTYDGWHFASLPAGLSPTIEMVFW